MASEPEVVAAAIDRARYQPEGRRSYGGQRYGMRPEPEITAEIRPAIYAMIETRRGCRRSTRSPPCPDWPACTSGRPTSASGSARNRRTGPPSFAKAVAEIVAAGHANGLPVTMHAVSASQAATWAAMEFDELVLTTDIELLRAAFAELIDGARRSIAGEIAAVPSALGAYGARK